MDRVNRGLQNCGQITICTRRQDHSVNAIKTNLRTASKRGGIAGRAAAARPGSRLCETGIAWRRRG
jgi:hypothetical protein